MHITNVKSLNDLTSPIAIVSHDAGAANLIVGWLKELDFSTHDVRISLTGPAEKIFLDEFPFLTMMKLQDVIEASSILLSGTSGASSLEHKARDIANKIGIQSVGVIDHWVNYRLRYERSGEQVLPTETWVSDEYAYIKASTTFPQHKIRLMPNRYMQQLIEKIKIKTTLTKKVEKTCILYVLEPVHDQWGDEKTKGEFQALDYFIRHIDVIDNVANVQIILRKHPSEAIDKYDRWCKKNSSLDLFVDTESSLDDLIAWADWVVGCQTFAMVIALNANKHVLSTLPPWAPKCKLPHENILNLSKI